MDHILVIGGTGNIGFPLIEMLSKNKDVKIKVGVHNVSSDIQKRFQNLNNVNIIPFDFLDSSTFPEAFLYYARQQKIQQIVFVSLIGVEKNPITPHHKIEKKIRQLEIPYTFIRPSFFMQNLSTTHLEDIRKHHDLFIPAGHAKTSFIDTRDIGETAAVCLTESKYINQELELTGPEALTYDEIAKDMSHILEVKISYSKPSLFKFRRVMIKRGIPKDYVNVMVMLYLITQLGNAKKVTKTVEKVLKRPPRSIQEFISDYRNDFIV